MTDLWSDYWELKGEAYEAGSVDCKDEECDGVAEPEKDGGHTYYACVECGMAFGYEQTDEEQQDGSCAIGVPEDLRKAHANFLESGSTSQSVPVTIGTRVRPAGE